LNKYPRGTKYMDLTNSKYYIRFGVAKDADDFLILNPDPEV
jgi:hypothetical protein